MTSVGLYAPTLATTARPTHNGRSTGYISPCPNCADVPVGQMDPAESDIAPLLGPRDVFVCGCRVVYPVFRNCSGEAQH